MRSFAEASAVTPLGDGRFQATFDDTWFQGRGVYGGMSGAVLIRAMASSVAAQGKTPRTMTVQYATTVAAGPATIETTIERAGTNTAFASARLVQDGVRVHAVASFGGDRSTDFDEDHERIPDAPAPDTLPQLSWRPPFPAFLQHFDQRIVHGLPYVGAKVSGVRLWTRSLVEEPIDLALATGLLDLPPPAILTRAAELRPMSTMVWHIHWLADLPVPAGWVLVDVRSAVTTGGYSSQETRMFSASGQLLAYGWQLVAVIK